jgi:hypothetical protein
VGGFIARSCLVTQLLWSECADAPDSCGPAKLRDGFQRVPIDCRHGFAASSVGTLSECAYDLLRPDLCSNDWPENQFV